MDVADAIQGAANVYQGMQMANEALFHYNQWRGHSPSSGNGMGQGPPKKHKSSATGPGGRRPAGKPIPTYSITTSRPSFRRKYGAKGRKPKNSYWSKRYKKWIKKNSRKR